MVCYVYVLQVVRSEALYGTAIAQLMETITTVKELPQRYYRVDFSGQPLRMVRNLSDTATSVKGHVTSLRGMRCPSMKFLRLNLLTV
jgi:hypothetical protein